MDYFGALDFNLGKLYTIVDTALHDLHRKSGQKNRKIDRGLVYGVMIKALAQIQPPPLPFPSYAARTEDVFYPHLWLPNE